MPVHDRVAPLLVARLGHETDDSAAGGNHSAGGPASMAGSCQPAGAHSTTAPPQLPSRVVMSTRAVLSCWQEVHGELPSTQQANFLRRPEVTRLVRMPSHVVQMAFRAHRRLVDADGHARWLVDGRLGKASCGCSAEGVDSGTQVGRHSFSVLPGPDGRAAFSSPRTPTFFGRCPCGWEKRAGKLRHASALVAATRRRRRHLNR